MDDSHYHFQKIVDNMNHDVLKGKAGNLKQTKINSDEV